METCQWEESQGREKCRLLQGPNEHSATVCWATTKEGQHQTSRVRWRKYWHWEVICTFYSRNESQGSQNTPAWGPLGSWLDVVKLLLHKRLFIDVGMDLEHSDSSSIVVRRKIKVNLKRSRSFRGCFLFLCVSCTVCHSASLCLKIKSILNTLGCLKLSG